MSTVDLGSIDPRLEGLERPVGTAFRGLATALAERYRVDVIIVRIAFIALAVMGGIGVAAYAWGTLLTRRAGTAEPPVARMIPAFPSWTRSTQLAVVVGSSVVLVAFGLTQVLSNILAGAVGCLVVGLMFRARRRQRAAALATRAPADGLDPVDLPEVDLYSPPAPAARPRARHSWLAAGLAVTVAAAAGLLLRLAVGLDPLVSLAGSALAVGVFLLAWTLLVPSRRVPGPVLVLCGALAVGTCWAGLGRADAQTNPTGTPTGNHAEYTFSGADAVLDLRDVPADKPISIDVRARVSDVRIILPGDPQELTIAVWMGDISAGLAPEPRPTRLRLFVESTLSDVTLEYR